MKKKFNKILFKRQIKNIFNRLGVSFFSYFYLPCPRHENVSLVKRTSLKEIKLKITYLSNYIKKLAFSTLLMVATFIYFWFSFATLFLFRFNWKTFHKAVSQNVFEIGRAKNISTLTTSC